MPTVHGEDAVIRILDKESANAEFKNLSLDVLGFDAETKKKLRKFIREPYGMVLVTGPTGSGKTTTLYACLSEIQSVEDKIVTIEDPVEYQLRGHHADPGQREEGAHVRARASARSSGTTPTRSWSARSATRRRPRSPSSRR